MRKFLITMLLALAIVPVNAQLPTEFGRFKKAATLSSDEENFVDKIARNGAFFISQSYQLEDSVGKFFGLKNNKEFGSDCSIAFKVKDGYLIYNRSRIPWAYNPDFSKVKDRYKPVLFPTQYSELGVKARYDSIYYDSKELTTIYPGQVYGLKATTFFNDGFYTAHNIGKTEGYMVWYTMPIGFDTNFTTDVNINTLKFTLNISSDRSKEYSVSTPQTGDIVIGGLFLVPEISSVGQLNFVLNGIAIPLNDADWVLICPFDDQGKVFDSKPVDTSRGNDIELELTPNNPE